MLVIQHRAVATAAADSLVLDALRKVLAGRFASAFALSHAPAPVFGIRWSSEVVRRVGSRRLNGLLVLIRNSKLSQENYNRVAHLWKEAFFNGENSPPKDWETWRTLIERFDMDDSAPLRDWIPVAQRCANQGFFDPSLLAHASQAQLNTLLAGEVVANLTRLLWRTAVVAFSDTSPGEVETIRSTCPDSETLIRAIRGATFQACRASRRAAKACSRLRVKKSFLSLGPAAKMKHIRSRRVSQKTMGSFFRRQSQLISLIGVEKAFPSFSSVARSYFSFCELKAVRSFSGEGKRCDTADLRIPTSPNLLQLRWVLGKGLLLLGPERRSGHPSGAERIQRTEASREIEYSFP